MPKKVATDEQWQACADAGMSVIQAVRFLGVGKSTAHSAVRRLGIKFRDGRADRAKLKDPYARTKSEASSEMMKKLNTAPEYEEARERRRLASIAHMKKLHYAPEYAEFREKQRVAASARMKARQSDPAINPLAALTPQQREDYKNLRKAGYPRDQALDMLLPKQTKLLAR